VKRGCDLLILFSEPDEDQKIAASFHSSAPTQGPTDPSIGGTIRSASTGNSASRSDWGWINFLPRMTQTCPVLCCWLPTLKTQ
jgi:hypothetical protein